VAERFVWYSPSGQQIDLTDTASGYSVQANGTRGLRSVNYQFTSSRYAGIDGETVEAITAEANRFGLGLLMRADDEGALRQRMRGLVRAMRPKAGLGTLTVSNEDGERRSISCYLEGGLEGDQSDDTHMPGAWWRTILRFYAPDPWWTGAEQRIDVGLGAGSTFFPVPPINLSASTVQGRFVIDLSDSDAPTFPVWTVTGPGSALVLRNETSGRDITVSVSLAAGETVVIDTRPDRQSVRRGDGTNLMGAVTSDPALWALLDGVNVVSVALAGATGASRIFGTFQPRFAGI
jgi:hypothetical protein